MDEFRKNLLVGVFVLGGLVALGTMIVLFGESPYALSPSYTATIRFPAAGPVRADDPIFLNGIEAGRVQSIEPLANIREGVQVVCTINTKYRIPVDAVPLIREQTLALGSPSIRIHVGPQNSDEMIATDGTGFLVGEVAGGIEELIPKSTIRDLEKAGRSLTHLAEALEPVANDLHELLKPMSVETIDTATTVPDRPLANVATVVQRFDMAIRNFNRIMGDPENRHNVGKIIENLRIVSERGLVLADRLVTLAERVDALAGSADEQVTRLARAISTNADKLNRLLDGLCKTSELLNAPKGSAGKFLNDPQLYESLSLTSRRLGLLLDEMHKLMIQWQEKGVKVEGGVLGR